MEDLKEEIYSVCEDLEINDEPFILDEFRKVKSFLQLGKDAGPDDIPMRTQVL